MFFLEVLYRIAGIFGGAVAGLNGVVALVEKCQTYMERHKAKKEKDPSASLAATDGSNDDCISNH